MNSTTQNRWLTEPQRRMLMALVQERPHLTSGQLAKIFEARTGRRVIPDSVSRVRRSGFRSLDSTHPRRHLTEGERAILERISHQAAPIFHRAEIARRFEAEAGRPIHRTAVGKFLARHFDDARPSGRAFAEGGAPC